VIMTELPEKALKLLALALNAGAEQGEWEAAAIKAVACMRKDGVPVQFFESQVSAPRKADQERRWKKEPAGFVMTFGKFKGTSITHIPDWYFEWLVEHIELRDPLKSAVEREILRRKENT
jgi:hypothetical protein